jgi:hypothetical protein
MTPAGLVFLGFALGVAFNLAITAIGFEIWSTFVCDSCVRLDGKNRFKRELKDKKIIIKTIV